MDPWWGHVLFVWPLLTRQRTTNYATGLNVIGQVVGRIGWNARKCVVSYEVDSKTYKITRYIKDAKPLDEVELIYLVGYPKSAELKSTIEGGNTDKRCRGFILALLMILMQVFGITAFILALRDAEDFHWDWTMLLLVSIVSFTCAFKVCAYSTTFRGEIFTTELERYRDFMSMWMKAWFEYFTISYYHHINI